MGALWYPVGFAAGYVAMLALVAAPMRRTGALTVPDFADARLGSAPLRTLSALVVLVIGCLYLVPQFAAAGQVLGLVSGTPYWVGVVLAGAAVSITLALGGMRAATYVQAFQFVLKLVLFIVPALWLVLQVGPDTRRDALAPVEFSRFAAATPVQFRLDTTFDVDEPTRVSVGGGPTQLLAPGRHVADAGSTWVFDAGAAVPRIGGGPPGGPGWARPLLDPSDAGHPLLSTWSVLVATVLGTMGLPHILIRFHTSPDGRGARRTAAITVALLGAFYLFPGVYGLLGAVLLPELYLSGATDTVVVALPAKVDQGPVGSLFTALLTAGAFAAFLATSLGLLLAVSGALSHDLVPGSLRRLRFTPLAAAGGGRAARAAGRQHRRGGAGHLGLRGRRVHLLPAAGAGHLVAAADRARGDGGHGGRPARLGRRDRGGPAARPAAGVDRDPARPARAVVGAAGVRDHGAGLAGRAAAGRGRGRDAAAAPGRAGRERGTAMSFPRRRSPTHHEQPFREQP